MLARILGGFWILFGLMGIIDPSGLRSRLRRKMSRRIRWVVLGSVMAFGLMIAGSVLGVPGILPRIIAIAGMLMAIRAIMSITSKTSERLFDWLGGRSLNWFRLWAALMTFMGFSVFFIK